MFERVTIVGVGLLGASLGLALKDRSLTKHIVGVGRKSSPSLDVALTRKAIDSSACDVATGAKGSDLVILCTPIRQFCNTLRDLAPVLLPDAIITDVGSTKVEVMQWAAKQFPLEKKGGGESPIFIGSHPMAGSEKRGPEHARHDLYEGSLCLLCTPDDLRQNLGGGESTGTTRTLAAFEKIQRLWRHLGMRTLWLPAKEHDRWVATISHLPHAVAFSLVNAAGREPQMLQAVAGGFIDTTRVASSDIDMWVDIFLTNRDAVTQAIDTFSADMTTLRQAIADGDEPAIRHALAAAKKTRNDMIAKRK
ncbi:MAG: prephenate dehydrogenase [Phycisphaerales bacterium]|nr:prephenate dehydrogenase [Phycisphaerales bacterium]